MWDNVGNLLVSNEQSSIKSKTSFENHELMMSHMVQKSLSVHSKTAIYTFWKQCCPCQSSEWLNLSHVHVWKRWIKPLHLNICPLKATTKYCRTAFAPQAAKPRGFYRRCKCIKLPAPPVHSHANKQQSFLLFLLDVQEDLKATDSSQTDTSCLEAPGGSCHLKLQPLPPVCPRGES